jgi:4-diphosphocytidyl-2-C-methyl-D-erythritol kinase
VAELAPAKVNLALHVTGRRPDGLHRLDSLVVFPRLGDLVEAEPAATLSLAIAGPFARELSAGPDNLVLRAALLLDPPGGAALRLTKSLPVASGIGGGSADAAATLRLLARLWGVPLPRPDAVLRLGADLPACLAGQACRMSGVGERLEPLALPAFWIVLANPGVPLATAAVFAGLASRANPPLPAPPHFTAAGALFDWLAAQRNDLEPPAFAAAPVIAETLAALAAQPGCRVARMSGSGATCFGLFAAEASALAAADALRRGSPEWWVAAAPVAGGRDRG